MSDLPEAIARLQEWLDSQHVKLGHRDHGVPIYFDDVRTVLAAVQQARLAGIAEGLEAAARVAVDIALTYEGQREISTGTADIHYGGCAKGGRLCQQAIRALSPTAIAKSAAMDALIAGDADLIGGGE